MIYIIITTSILNKVGVTDPVHRQNRYVECISHLLQLLQSSEACSEIRPIIVENNGSRETFLDSLGCEVCYTDNNRPRFAHKGVNELADIKEVIRRYNIQDEDIIIKLTGRYKVLDLEFIHTVIQEQAVHDAFVKFFNVCTLEFLRDDCVLGLFAMRCKYLNAFAYRMTEKSPECVFAEYVRSRVPNVKEVQDLRLECCFADDLRILNV